MKILVAIPAYNCENQIVRVLNQFKTDIQKFIDTVIVIDNQSSDKTLENAINAGEKNFKISNFLVFRNSKNYGLGGSHKVAFNYAIKNNFDYVAIFHGDDQGSFHDLCLIFQKNSHVNFDCLLGSRFSKGSRLQGYSFIRTLGNIIYNKIFSFGTNYKISDLGSGLNLYRVQSLKSKYFGKFPDDLTFNYVMILASIHFKQKIKFFPISWREEDQISNVRLFKQAFKVLSILFKFTTNKNKFLSSDMRSSKLKLYSSKIIFRKS